MSTVLGDFKVSLIMGEEKRTERVFWMPNLDNIKQGTLRRVEQNGLL